jgi:prevent-host-death family protein
LAQGEIQTIFWSEVAMGIVSKITPISTLKAEAPAVIRSVAEDRTPVVITVNGEAKAVLQDVESYEATQDAIALLRILALANASVEQGKVKPLRTAVKDIRRRGTD